jgi:transcriptional regulator with XRE-family HTH domain
MKIRITKERNPLAEAFAESIATIESQVEVQKLTIVEELLQFMKRNGIKRTELAERMGVLPSRITKMLSGDSNLTIDTLVRAGHAVGADLVQTFIPKGQRGHWVTARTASKDSSCIEVEFSSKKPKQAATPLVGDRKPAQKDAEDAA